MDMHRERKTRTVGEVLLCTICRAVRQNRLTYGVINCATVLSRYSRQPDKVLLCIMPLPGNTIVSIQHKLLDAYCRENNFRLLQVDSSQKLSRLLQLIKAGHHDDPDVHVSADLGRTDPDADHDCVVVLRPDEMTNEEDFIISYYNTVVYCNLLTSPCIKLPDN